MTHDYIVVYDKDLDYCRLFRADAVEAPAGPVLWSGNGLRAGYDAMIRLNKERRPVKAYSVCESLSSKGRRVFRIVLGEPEENWTALSIHYEHSDARSALKALVRKRNAEEEAEKAEIARIMERVGMPPRRTKPRFTETDLRYLSWLKETGRFAA